MDFLKSAVASAISKGPLAGYNLGDRVDTEQSIFTLQNGVKRVRNLFGNTGQYRALTMSVPGRECEVYYIHFRCRDE